MDVSSVKPGNVIKFEMPKDPFLMGSGGTKVFEVKAVIGDQLYGQELNNINKSIDDETPYSEKPDFEIIA